ncbi:hypothetical protein E2C01_026325 [Portunus trituberculatus]|uniref:Uncharacterized protein n=1 Tax=Portunus trituberculatus TaxID=210409 RepID=A0A5B7EI94_PORTR|nr:hypothetical protein [Portunus trituberculatus]
MRQCVKDIGICSFPDRTLEKWNALSDEVVTAHNEHNFKEKLMTMRQNTMTPARTLHNTTK